MRNTHDVSLQANVFFVPEPAIWLLLVAGQLGVSLRHLVSRHPFAPRAGMLTHLDLRTEPKESFAGMLPSCTRPATPLAS